MMRTILILLFVGSSVSLLAQDYAGEDETACSGTGVTIGKTSPNSNHCYLWELADGMPPDQVNLPNPTVTPNETTSYSVTVTDQNFSFRAVDVVEVVIDFGCITFNPKYILPDGEDNQCEVKLNCNNRYGTPDPFTWSIDADPDNTGCTIDPNTGWISGCSSGGTITVKATNDNNTACVAKEDIEVNVGVKDVIVKDLDSPGREIHVGDTLYLIGSSNVQIEAIPNEESSFPAGQPEWSGDLTPAEGNVAQWDAFLLANGTTTITAGDDKTVVIIRLGANPVSIGESIDKKALQKLKGTFEQTGLPGITGAGNCATIPVSVTIPSDASLQASLSWQNVEKYQDPDYAKKIAVTLQFNAISVAGCLPLPCCYGNVVIPGGSAKAFAYVRAAAGISFNINVEKDPSSEQPEDWLGSVGAAGNVEIAGGVGIDVSLGPVGINGGAEAFTDAKMEVRIRNKLLEYRVFWGGFHTQINGGVYYMEPSNVIAPLKLGPWEIMKGSDGVWSLISDLSELF